MRVEQVVAGPERTQITFSLPGFSESDLPGPIVGAGQAGFAASLVLEAGSRRKRSTGRLVLGPASWNSRPCLLTPTG